MIIEVELERLKIISDWKKKIRAYDAYSYYFSNNFDALIKFLKLEDPVSENSIISFFFQYIRTLELKPIDDSIFDTLGLQFLKKMKKLLQDDDMLETIRLLQKIFYKVKNYRALLSYQEFFKEMKLSGEIQTNLSARNFTKNVRMLGQRSFCGPIYQLDWNTINLSFFIVYLRFDPKIRWYSINRLLNFLPFYLNPRFSIMGLSTTIFGYFVIPKSYVNDLKKYILFLKEKGYVREGALYCVKHFSYFLNLNYLREIYDENKFVTPKNKDYRKDFELKFSMDYSEVPIIEDLSLLDFLILDRVRHFSITGFGFERREATLTQLKSDLLNEISYQKNLVQKLKEQLDLITKSEDLEQNFLKLLNGNLNVGFFLLKLKLQNIIKVSQLLPTIFEGKKLSNLESFKERVQMNIGSGSFDDILILNEENIIKTVFKDLYPIFITSRSKFNEELNRLKVFYEFLKNCGEMKIFDLHSIQEIIKNRDISKEIYETKEAKLESIYSESEFKQITIQEVEDRIEFFCSTDPPVIHPILINSIPAITIARQYFIILLNYSPEIIEELKEYFFKFPLFVLHIINDEFSGKNIIYCEFSLPNLSVKERTEFISIFNTQFHQDILISNRFLNPGMYTTFSRKDFYNFLEKKFLYKKSLFDEFKRYSLRILGPNLSIVNEKVYEKVVNIWDNKKKISELISNINISRYRKENKLIPNELDQLKDFQINIDKILTNNNFFEYKQKFFYQNYIKRINLIPIWYRFGLEKFYLYIQPTDPNFIDYRMLLTNTFQSIKMSIQSPSFISFFIKYIFPKSRFYNSYTNWLLLSKKIFSEYLLFSVKKIIRYTNFHQNLDPNGWIIDVSKFEAYVYKILFDSNYIIPKLEAKVINFDGEGEKRSPNSPEFKSLVKIFKMKSLNLKKYIKTKLGGKVESAVIKLLKSKYISVYTKFKNLALREHIAIIIPDLNQTQKNKIIDILRFFNIVRISEINGEYHVYNFTDKITFENGLFIKIWFPNIEISLYVELFNKILELLDVRFAFFFTEMFKSKSFPTSVFSALDLNSYNPLMNLKWDEINKEWINWKLINENFEFNYPPIK